MNLMSNVLTFMDEIETKGNISTQCLHILNANNPIKTQSVNQN